MRRISTEFVSNADKDFDLVSPCPRVGMSSAMSTGGGWGGHNLKKHLSALWAGAGPGAGSTGREWMGAPLLTTPSPRPQPRAPPCHCPAAPRAGRGAGPVSTPPRPLPRPRPGAAPTHTEPRLCGYYLVLHSAAYCTAQLLSGASKLIQVFDPITIDSGS